MTLEKGWILFCLEVSWYIAVRHFTKWYDWNNHNFDLICSLPYRRKTWFSCMKWRNYSLVCWLPFLINAEKLISFYIKIVTKWKYIRIYFFFLISLIQKRNLDISNKITFVLLDFQFELSHIWKSCYIDFLISSL